LVFNATETQIVSREHEVCYKRCNNVPIPNLFQGRVASPVVIVS